MTVAVLFTTSCAKEDISSSIANGETVEVTFTANLPELGTRAIGKGESATTLKFFVYEYQNEGVIGTYLPDVKMYTADDNEGTNTISSETTHFNFSLSLIKGMKYNIVFWADKGGDNSPYSVDGTGYVTVNYTGASANDDSRDAFFGVLKNFDPAAADAPQTARDIKLTRPFAQLNAATLDLTDVQNSGIVLSTLTSSVKVENAYTTLNLFNGEVSNSTPVTFAATAIPATNNEVLPGKSEYDYLAMNYVLVSDKKLVEATFTIYGKRNENDSDENKVKLAENKYTSVPLQRNYRTNILGKLITKSTDFEVEILPGFGGEETINVWDGKTVTAPAYDVDTKTYTVTNGAELAWIAAAANGTTRGDVDTFIGQNIVLANDIELGGHNWTPISMSTNLSGGETFRGTFNGQGHTISGLVSNQKDAAGLFGYIYAATIKNVTVKGASINSNHYAAGIVAWILNTKGNIQVPTVIENCHVVNSTITSTPELVNGEWDNGDKVGGLVGYACFGDANYPTINNGAGIKNCSVENTTVKAYRDFGGLLGYAKYANIVDCAVNNVTLEQDLSHDYKAPNTPTTYGEFIGRNDGGNTIDGGQLVASGVTTKDGAYYITSAEGFAWVEAQADAFFAGKTIKLANNIDMAGIEYNPIRFWEPENKTTFDGQNYTISNITIGNSSLSNAALFNGTLSVKNLKIDNATVTGNGYVAVIGGTIYGDIDNCHISNSTVIGNYWQVGGFAGQYNSGNITNCSITNTSITGPSAVGALAGITNETPGERKFENCTISGCTIEQNHSFGGDYDSYYGVATGLVNISNSTVCFNNCTVKNNTIKGVASDTLVGEVEDGTTILINGVCLTIVDGYTDLFKNDAGDYCLLNKQSLIDWHAFLAKNTTRNPYNCNVKMLADIDAAGWTWNSLWITPAAGNLTGLQFDGQNHTISNLNIAGEGMFLASLAGMAFKNLTINGVEVASTDHNAAVFAGSAYSSVSFENVTVKNANVNGPCNTGIFVGGTLEPNNLVISFKNCSVETSSVTAVGKNGQDPTGASGFVGKAYGSTKLVFEGTNSIDDDTTITNQNGLVGGKVYGYTVYANGVWTGTGASNEFVNWDGLN